MSRLHVVLAAVLALGCADAIVFGTNTTFGVKIKPAKDNQTKLTVGYARDEVAIFPRKLDAQEREPHVYSVLAWLRLTNRWPQSILGGIVGNSLGIKPGLCIRSEFATGIAAENLANSALPEEVETGSAADPCAELKPSP